ncbi:DUF6624 domain-containing protein [Streptomyces fildesensis]|uniref:DUF6624 domain-containing protein n=1 Tax=Streptomyces fildesensis TaxID=375757 RepID=UPI0018DF4B8B|nr:DUF6624 domain-containing protein [Streptomyces fildesensis]
MNPLPLRPDLARDLLLRKQRDQELRHEWATSPRTARSPEVVDRANTEALRRIIAEHGWPGHSLVGPEAADAAWLLAQHADHDHSFQWECLALLGQAARDGEATGQQLAYLTDRCRLNSQVPQIYGTQYIVRNGELALYDLEDPENLELRRADVGLECFTESDTRIRSAHPLTTPHPQ